MKGWCEQHQCWDTECGTLGLKCARHGCPAHRASGSVWCMDHKQEAEAGDGGVSLTCDNLPAIGTGCRACNGTGKVFDELVLEMADCPFGCPVPAKEGGAEG